MSSHDGSGKNVVLWAKPSQEWWERVWSIYTVFLCQLAATLVLSIFVYIESLAK